MQLLATATAFLNFKLVREIKAFFTENENSEPTNEKRHDNDKWRLNEFRCAPLVVEFSFLFNVGKKLDFKILSEFRTILFAQHPLCAIEDAQSFSKKEINTYFR